MWRDLPRLRSAEKFPAWADRILVNACRLVLRRRAGARMRLVQLNDDPTAGSRALIADSQDVEVADRDVFDRAFESLSVDARAILVLHHLEGRPVAAIAEALAIPVGTAKSRLFGARRDLEHALDRERQ
jgi:RNA polymerase sigma-70 factor (ECF subfamily)